ncbi:MAG: galactose mutarotase [Planctomycetaceae bacterium]|nr:galactose mutarotase [Planctomycetaceae bacterium]
MKKLPIFLLSVSLTLCFCLLNAAAQEPNNTPATEAGQQGTPQMKITKSEFGKTADGITVDKYLLDNGKGITVEVLTLGGIIFSFNVPDKNGQVTNVSANLETVADYEKYRPFFGALVGRYGNRIANGKFTLDGKEYTLPTNNGKNSLHGGKKGFDTKVWNAKEIKGEDHVGLELTCVSVDGEEGYPGTLNVTVKYILDKNNRWMMEYTATTDKPTVLNLTNHTYWNLAGFPKGKPSTNHEHILRLNADRFLPTDDTLIPTGELKQVAGTPLDFRTPHKIGERIAQVEGAHFAGGYDHCFILNQEKPGQPVLCAEIIEPNSGRTMMVQTTEPGVQFYSGNFLSGSMTAFGHKYEKHASICLETQHYPNSPNNATFPSTVLRPGEKFTSVTIHTFGITQ